MRAGRCFSHGLGCLWEACLKHGEDLRVKEGFLEIKKVPGGNSVFVPKRFQGGFRAQVLTLPVLSVGCASGHVSLHVEVEDVAAREVSFVESLFVAQGVSLVPEEVQEAREAGVVLKRKGRSSINTWFPGGYGFSNGFIFFLCIIHKC